MIETKTGLSPVDLQKRKEWKDIFQGEDVLITGISEPFTHQLTHQVVIARFLKLKTKAVPKLPVILVRIRDLEKFPFSRLIERYLAAYPIGVKE